MLGGPILDPTFNPAWHLWRASIIRNKCSFRILSCTLGAKSVNIGLELQILISSQVETCPSKLHPVVKTVI